MSRILQRLRARIYRKYVLCMGKSVVWLPSSVTGPAPFITVGDQSLIMGRFECQRLKGLISIGSQSYIAPGALIDCANQVVIGNHVLVGNDVIISDHDSHSSNWDIRQHDVSNILSAAAISWQHIQVKTVCIEDHVWIGRRAVILKGVHLGMKCIVGAGSIVTHSFPAGSIIAGNPARLIRSIPTDLELTTG